jgi:hypothetical protein
MQGGAVDPRDRMMVVLGIVAVVMSAGLGTALHTGLVGGGEGKGEVYADWSQIETRTISFDGYNSKPLDVVIPEHNLTRLDAVLTWKDDEAFDPLGLRADILTLQVVGPPDLGAQQPRQSGTAGKLGVNFTLANVPSDPDPKHMSKYDYTNGTGTWKVTVTVDAKGLRDKGNDWGLAIRYTYYVGRLLPRQEATR